MILDKISLMRLYLFFPFLMFAAHAHAVDTPLSRAILRQDVGVVKRLLEDPNVELRRKGEGVVQPVHYLWLALVGSSNYPAPENLALTAQQKEIVHLLLQKDPELLRTPVGESRMNLHFYLLHVFNPAIKKYGDVAAQGLCDRIILLKSELELLVAANRMYNLPLFEGLVMVDTGNESLEYFSTPFALMMYQDFESLAIALPLVYPLNKSYLSGWDNAHSLFGFVSEKFITGPASEQSRWLNAAQILLRAGADPHYEHQPKGFVKGDSNYMFVLSHAAAGKERAKKLLAMYAEYGFDPDSQEVERYLSEHPGEKTAINEILQRQPQRYARNIGPVRITAPPEILQFSTHFGPLPKAANGCDQFWNW